MQRDRDGLDVVKEISKNELVLRFGENWPLSLVHDHKDKEMKPQSHLPLNCVHGNRENTELRGLQILALLYDGCSATQTVGSIETIVDRQWIVCYGC